MAVFGIPLLHEDDAVRAVRAAIDMQAALTELNAAFDEEYGVCLDMRIGVHTGEVITNATASDQALIAGDAVNAAARLQSAAPLGSVLIGPATYQLVADVVESAPHGELSLRGKSQPLATWRVLGVASPSRAPTFEPIAGRGRELGRLAHNLDQAADQERCIVSVITGTAGVGKSHLARTFAASLDPATPRVVGRCLPYGEGITYWPLKEITDGLGGFNALERVMAGDARGTRAATILESALGRSSQPATPQDVQWAVRTLVESLARLGPAVMVLDDVHWAEPAMLDLVEYLHDYATARPILIVAVARDELLDVRPGWRTRFGRAAHIGLRPLSQADARRLIDGLPGATAVRGQRREILAAAEGNPLFVKQLVAMRSDDPTAAIPPTVQALLGARVDALPDQPRRVIEAAAVEGRTFHRTAVSALLAEAALVETDAALDELVRRELIRPATPALPRSDAFRFTHILVRDAAYELIPKRRRAGLHTRFAEWLQTAHPGQPELDEFTGYHLEQAYRLRAELGRADNASVMHIAADASRHLGAAGRRALRAGDRRGSANLLSRALSLHIPHDVARVGLLFDVGTVQREEGELAKATATFAEAAAGAASLDATPFKTRAEVERLLTQLQVDPDDVAQAVASHGDALELELNAAEDRAGLAHLSQIRGLLAWIRGHAGDAAAHWRAAADEARAANDDRMLHDMLGWEAATLTAGPTPVNDALQRCHEILEELRDDPWAEALACHQLAALMCMAGRLDEGVQVLDAADATLAGFTPTLDAAVSHPVVIVALLTGDLARGERHLRTGRRLLGAMGERAVLASTECYLAQIVLHCGRTQEADRIARRAAALATGDDITAQTMWRRVRALALAEIGRTSRATVLAVEAVNLMAQTDWLNESAGTLADLSRVYELAGRKDEARTARKQAGDLYLRKGNVVAARRVGTGRTPSATSAK